MSAIPYPDEYIDYLAEYYGSRDYFECHEIMEEYWKENPDSLYTVCWLVLIRISVCLYHARRGNWTGAIKLMGKAVDEVDAQLFDQLGLNGAKLAESLEQAVQTWKLADAAYADIELPITDVQLLDAAKLRSLELGYTWGISGMEAGEQVINRHLTRDRSEVVAERQNLPDAKHLLVND